MSLPKGSEVETQAKSSGATPSAVPDPCPGGDVPREGSRDIQQKGKIISVPHDWCKSQSAPVPYRIWAWQSSASNLANSVRQTDCRSHVLGSIVNQCYGDEPGTGGGVKSGTHNAECTPLSASPTVRAEDKPMVRYLDKWWMNHKNTWGCLNNSEDIGRYDTPKIQNIDSKLSSVQNREDDLRSLAEDTRVAGGGVAGGASTSTGSGNLAKFVAMAPQAKLDPALKAPDPATRPLPIPNATTHGGREGIVRVSAGCDRLIGTYDSIKDQCAGKSDEDETDTDLTANDHHLVPDYTMGGTRGCRETNSCRFDNMPSFGNMPAICLQGFTKDRGSEHQVVQSTVNSSIQDLGQTPTLERVIQFAKKDTIERLQHMSNLSEACAEKIRKAIDDAYQGIDKNQRVRGSAYYRQDIYDHLKAPGGQFKDY